MASYNTGLTWKWSTENGTKISSWGPGGVEYFNFGYKNVARSGTTITFDYDLYIKQTTTQNIDRWAVTIDSLGISNATVKGYGSTWSEYPLGYYNLSANPSATTRGGANTYGTPKKGTITGVEASKTSVTFDVQIRDTGYNGGWVVPYGDTNKYPTRTISVTIPVPSLTGPTISSASVTGIAGGGSYSASVTAGSSSSLTYAWTIGGKSASGASGTVTGLADDTTFDWSLTVTDGNGLTATKSGTFKTLISVVKPTLSALTSSAASSTSISASFTVSSNGNGTITAQGIQVSTASNFSSITKSLTTNSGTLSGLSRNTTYYVRGYATNSAGTTYTETDTITTPVDTPVLSAVSVSGITSTGATLSFSVSDNGGKTISSNTIGVYSDSGCTTLVKSVSSTSGSVTGLTRNTTYYAKASASNGSKTGYSAVATFTTLKETPKIGNVSVTNIKSTSASASFSVTDNGGSAITDNYIDCFTSSDCTAESKVGVISSTSGSFTGLTRNTKYYVRANASNGTYRGYSAVGNFTTSKETPTVSAISVSGITSTGATLSFTVSDNGGSATTNTITVYSDSNCTTAVKTISGNSGSVTGLNRNTTYYVKGTANNGSLTGTTAVKSFTTLKETPTVSAITVGTVTSTSAVLSFSVTDNGGSSTTNTITVYSDSGCTTAVKTISGTSGTASGLTRNKTYYAKATANNGSYTGTSAVKSFTTLAETPVLSAITISNVTSTGATLSFSVTDNGGKAITSNTIKIYSDSGCTKEVKSISGTSGSVTDLTRNTIYYAKASASNGSYTGYSAVKSFETNSETPILSAVTISSITTNSAKASFSVTNDGGSTIASNYIYLYSDSGCTNKVGTITGTSGTFSSLTRYTKYYVRAQATNESLTGYSAVANFTTNPENPKVSALTTSSTDTSITASFTVSDPGGKTITSSKIYLYESSSATTALQTIDGTSGTFSNLTPHKTYYVKGYTTNGITEAYTAVKTQETSFTKPGKPGTITLTYDTAELTKASKLTVTWGASSKGSTATAGYRVQLFKGSTELYSKYVGGTTLTETITLSSLSIVPGDVIYATVYAYATCAAGDNHVSDTQKSGNLTLESQRFVWVSINGAAFKQCKIHYSNNGGAFIWLKREKIKLSNNGGTLSFPVK